jgi:hypothetical protein
MSDAVRRLRANRKLEHLPCGWCYEPLQLGDDTAVCTACGANHHGKCWDDRGGCSGPSCVAAPLKRLSEPPMAQPPPGAAAAAAACPHCKVLLPLGTAVCPACKQVTTPDGIYHGFRRNCPRAVSALVLGIVGIFVCGVILGIIAIHQSVKAKEEIAADPTMKGEGMATAGLVLGIVALVGWVIFLIVRL